MVLTVGSRLGHYDVTALIGEGGMGQVYQATDTKLERHVALKILPEAFAADPDRLARFQREAQVLASLNHPGIAQIHGIEETEDTRALVLELVEGPTLADRIAQGPIPVDEALPIAKQIAEALEAAHEAGVIHRDLKPANIKVREDGTVKVLDFGLAKALDTAPEGDPNQSPTLTAAATQMGVIMGTAAYMSPEQARGKPVDKRADIWAFGVVVYEMLTGRRAFEGEDISVTLADVIRADVNWEPTPGDLPPALTTFLRRCLDKDPTQRLRDIGDMRLALGGAFETPASAVSASQTAPSIAIWQRPAALFGVVAAAVLLTGLAMWSLIGPAPGRVARFPISLGDGQVLTNTNRPTVAVSPDGALIVYVADDNLWLRPVDQLDATLLSGTTDASGPFFSSDSQSIGFWADGQLKKVAVTGGAAVTIADVPEDPDGATWGTDDMIHFGGDGGIFRVAGASGLSEMAFPLGDGEAAHGPQILPGGAWALFTLRGGGQGSWGEAQIAVQSSATGERTLLFEGRDARYLETGHLVYLLDNVIFSVPFDVDSRTVTGGPVPLVEDVAHAGSTGGAAQFSVSRDGLLVYVTGAAARTETGWTLAWVSLTGEEIPIAAPSRLYQRVRVSPDGTRIVAEIIGEDGNSDIWIWRLDQGPLTRLTFHDAVDYSPLWTPDGERIVFTSRRDGGGLFWKAADGTGEVERLLESSLGMRTWGWSTDGRLVLSREPGDIGVLDVEGERGVEMLVESEFLETTPALSPDGRWLAYASAESGQFEVYVQPFPNVDDGKWQVSTTSGVFPLWSADGRRLYYVTLPAQNRLGAQNRMMVAEVVTDPTFAPGSPTEVFDTPYRYILEGSHDLAADGERFLVQVLGGTEVRGEEASLVVVQNWSQELLERVPVD